MSEIPKYEIALELLESSLFSYYESQSYFSALHCAGAAEEILGRYVTFYGGESSYKRNSESLKKIELGLSGIELSSSDLNEFLNSAKNITKHGKEDLSGSARVSAKQMLERAIENYHSLSIHIQLREIERLTRFETEQ